MFPRPNVDKVDQTIPEYREDRSIPSVRRIRKSRWVTLVEAFTVPRSKILRFSNIGKYARR